MTTLVSVARPRSRRASPLRRREAITGYVYISPWLIGFLIFSLFPFIASLYLSFTDYAIIKPPKFIGLQNYIQAFTKDNLFWPSLRITFFYAGVSVPLGIAGSLFCAILLNQKLRGTALWRTLYFLPSLTPVVSLALLWKWLLQPDFGLINYLLGKIGIRGPGWLGSTEWAVPALILMSLWGSVGGGRMIIFLAGLQGVPEELYEAAEIDGAGIWPRFWHITLPMISPTMFFNLVLGIIDALQVFATAYVATQGGPAYATWFYILHLFAQAFKYMHMGYASALAWIFLVIVLFLTWIQIRMSERWVFYAGMVR